MKKNWQNLVWEAIKYNRNTGNTYTWDSIKYNRNTGKHFLKERSREIIQRAMVEHSQV